VFTESKASGAISSTPRPRIHLSCQKRILDPSPTSSLARLRKTARALGSWVRLRPCQGRLSSVRRSHSQRTRSAKPWSLRSLTPSPPNLLGLLILSHATRH
jgi:hypothetical protein